MGSATEKLCSPVNSGLAAVGCWCLHPSPRPEQGRVVAGTPSPRRPWLLLNSTAIIPRGPGGAWLWGQVGLAPSTAPNPAQGRKTRSSQGLSGIGAACARRPAPPQRGTGPRRAGWDEAGGFL